MPAPQSPLTSANLPTFHPSLSVHGLLIQLQFGSSQNVIFRVQCTVPRWLAPPARARIVSEKCRATRKGCSYRRTAAGLPWLAGPGPLYCHLLLGRSDADSTEGSFPAGPPGSRDISLAWAVLVSSSRNHAGICGMIHVGHTAGPEWLRGIVRS